MQRTLCGLIGLMFAVGGTVAYWQAPQQGAFFAASAIRAGSLLLVTWLAWHQLAAWKDRLPQVLIVGVGVLAAVLVLRPRLGRIAIVVVVSCVVLSMALRWLATLTGPPKS